MTAKFVFTLSVLISFLGGFPSCSSQSDSNSVIEINKARALVLLLLKDFEDWQEPFPPEWQSYEVTGIRDINGDGSYEIACRFAVEGSAANFSGPIFSLVDSQLVLISSSTQLMSERGDIALTETGAVLTSPAWAPEDAHCCPSLVIREEYRYSRDNGFVRISSDTARSRVD